MQKLASLPLRAKGGPFLETTPASKPIPLSLNSTATPETPHVYLFSPSTSIPTPEHYCTNGSTNDEHDLSLSLLDKQAEITSLRHKIQCMESYESDLIEELKILQEENDNLHKKMSEMKSKDDSSSFIIQSCSSPIVFDSFCGSDFDSKLSEELSKSKANLSVLEDRNYELALERDEVIMKLQKKDEMLKQVKEDLKLLQQELWESLQEKQALVSDVSEKVSIIESLQNHCEELKEMLDQKREPSKLVTPVGMIKYFHPTRSLNCSYATDASISEEPLDLGFEVIDLQLQEAKASLASTQESLKITEEDLRSERRFHKETSEKLSSVEDSKKVLETRIASFSEEVLRLKTLLFDNNNSSAKLWQLESSKNDLDAEKKELNFALRLALEELISLKEEFNSKYADESNDSEKIKTLTQELKYLAKENDLKSWDLQVAYASVKNLEERLSSERENWIRTELKLKNRCKKIDKGTMPDPTREDSGKDLLIVKLQEQVKHLEEQNRIQVEKLKENVLQESKEKYKQRFETYRQQVASIVKQEGDNTTKLKKSLADANSRIRQLETENDWIKRDLAQLRKDYNQSQLVIHSLKDKEKHKPKPAESPKKTGLTEAPNRTVPAEVPKRVQFETPKRLPKRSSAETPSRSVPASPTKPRRSMPVAASPRFEEDFFMTQRLRRLPEDRFGLDNDERKSELCRRNSMVLPHMKSCYPMEYIVCQELEVDTLFKPPAAKNTGLARKVDAVTQSAPNSPMPQRRNGKMAVRFENRM